MLRVLSISTLFSETNLVRLFQAHGFVLYSRAAEQCQTFALQKLVCMSRSIHVSSPIHDKALHEAKQMHKNAS